MPDLSCVFNAAFKDVLSWIPEYAQRRPPPPGGQLRCVIDDRAPDAHGRGPVWLATVWANSPSQPEVRLISIMAAEENGKCRIGMRCMDPFSETWFQDLVDFVRPDDAAGDAARDGYPLPDLPSPGTTAASPLAPAPTPAPVDKNLPYAPKHGGKLREWKATWRVIKPRVAEGMSSAEIAAWLLRCRQQNYRTKQTIAKIIKAGEAGLLG